MILKMKQTALALTLFGAIGLAQATPLPVSTTTANVDITSTFFGGTLLASAITNVCNDSYNGIARSAVYSTVSGLDFYYQFSNDPTSKNAIGRFTGSDFSPLGSTLVNGFQTDQAFRIFAAGNTISTNADRGPFGVSAFDFEAAPKLMPGKASFTQIIRTNATNYTAGNCGLLDGIGDNATGFAPALAVPEPKTYALLLAGLGLMGTIAGRRTLS